jgi:tRNA-Thr(GGU) m(6)t(6)A37 methyltransferase TsaA
MKRFFSSHTFEPIGYVNSCFKEKFGIPRQSGLVKQATGILKLRDDPNLKTALQGLEGFSHVWLIFVFHQPGSRSWKPSVRPPRLGGAQKVGVLASRSPHRPNPIGLSAVVLDRVVLDAVGGPELFLSGIDLLDGTPILDVKPYLPYADALPDASSGWASEPIKRQEVHFTAQAEQAILKRVETGTDPRFKSLILEILELDPRPSFLKRKFPTQSAIAQGTQYGFRLFEFDVKWEIVDGIFHVCDVVTMFDV